MGGDTEPTACGDDGNRQCDNCLDMVKHVSWYDGLYLDNNDRK